MLMVSGSFSVGAFHSRYVILNPFIFYIIDKSIVSAVVTYRHQVTIKQLYRRCSDGDPSEVEPFEIVCYTYVTYKVAWLINVV